jgi:ribulose-bisphosphate carboxylase large chain
VTSGPIETLRRAQFAKEHGAGMLLISPGLCGFETMKIAGEQTDLPVMCHPAFAGSHTISDIAGISHRAILGQIPRLAGADAIVFPHHGGRFPYTESECRDLLVGMREPIANWQQAMPTPGGGMSLQRVPEIVRFYGRDVVLLIGGGLFRSGNLVDACKQFRNNWADEIN